MNVPVTSANTSGIKGVCYNKSTNKWQAYIQAKKERFYLGSFASKEIACDVRAAAEADLHKEFAANLRAGRKG